MTEDNKNCRSCATEGLVSRDFGVTFRDDNSERSFPLVSHCLRVSLKFPRDRKFVGHRCIRSRYPVEGWSVRDAWAAMQISGNTRERRVVCFRFVTSDVEKVEDDVPGDLNSGIGTDFKSTNIFYWAWVIFRWRSLERWSVSFRVLHLGLFTRFFARVFSTFYLPQHGRRHTY